jgi:hypothetical protein
MENKLLNFKFLPLDPVLDGLMAEFVKVGFGGATRSTGGSPFKTHK